VERELSRMRKAVKSAPPPHSKRLRESIPKAFRTNIGRNIQM